MDIKISPLEIKLFIQAIHEAHGYDFSEYSPESFRRRLTSIIEKHNLQHVGECIHRSIHDKDFFLTILGDLTITVTEMFRDPYMYSVLRQAIIPYLKTYPKIKIWHAGCATGEEVYSFAILLKESGLTNRTITYATDINKQALCLAKKGYIKNNSLQQGVSNYFKSGGDVSLSHYISHDEFGSLIELENRNNIVFSEHNLVNDYSFGEMQIIFCRNVLIYFIKSLQNKVLELLTESLCPGGFLCLGSKESISFSAVSDKYETIDAKAKIYRKHIKE